MTQVSVSRRFYREKTLSRDRQLPNYFKVLIHYPHMMLIHRDPHVISFTPIDPISHQEITSRVGYDFKNIDDYIDFLHQHNVVKHIEKLSHNKIIFWINIFTNKDNTKREISWKWGGYDVCQPITIDKANDFVTQKMFYMASNVICIEQVFYTHIKNKHSFYTPYVVTFDC